MAEPAQDELIILLTTGTIGILLLAVFIVLFFFIYQRRMLIAQREKQKLEIDLQYKMAYAQLESQERERVRIASDLHDSLGSLLWSAKVNATFIDRSVSLKGETRESYQELLMSLDQSIEIVRRIAWELTPEAFQHTGLSASLSGLCNRINGKSMKVTYQQEGDHFHADDKALQVFRIAQELVSNCVKHAKATEMLVHFVSKPDIMILKVEDNGIGFTLEENRRGVGWWNIEQRVRRLKAKITIGKNPYGSGTSVTLTVPLNHDE